MFESEIFEFIEIETTNTCNRSCSFCIFGIQTIKEKAKRMPWGIIDKIIYELSVLRYSGVLAWYSLNEPLLDKRIFEIIKKSKENIPFAKIALVSNGDLLTVDVTSKLIRNGLDILRISVYDDLIFEKAKQLKKEFKEVDYFDMRHNPKLSNRGGAIKGLNQAHNVVNQNCLHPSKNMVINVDGKLKLCCDDLYSNVMPTNYNLTEKSLVELWNSEKINFYRKELKSNGRVNLKLCSNCSFNNNLRWPN